VAFPLLGLLEILLVLVVVLLVGWLSYTLGRRKTTMPKLATAVGVVLMLCPPLALVYLLVLYLKKDVPLPSPQLHNRI